MKAITHANNWSLTLAFHIFFTWAPVNFAWAQAQGVATPLSSAPLISSLTSPPSPQLSQSLQPLHPRRSIFSSVYSSVASIVGQEGGPPSLYNTIVSGYGWGEGGEGGGKERGGERRVRRRGREGTQGRRGGGKGKERGNSRQERGSFHCTIM